MGNSLTANLLAREGDVIVDFWEGGSDLYGWSLGSECLDRVPIFLRRDCCRLFSGSLKEVDVEVVVEGPESGVARKLGDVGASVIGYGGRLFVPARPACAYYRELLRRPGAVRVFSPITEVDLRSRIVRTYHCEVEYEELVSTLPLHYFLLKSRLNELRERLEYVPAYVLTLASGTRLKDYTKVFVGHGGYSLGYVASYGSHPAAGRLVYALVPLVEKRLRAEIESRAIAELKRLKLVEGPLRLARSLFVKYFIMRGDTEGVRKVLESYGVVLAGRYGTWSEASLCDVCQ